MKKLFVCLTLLCVFALVICACAGDPVDTSTEGSDSGEIVESNLDSNDVGNNDTNDTDDNTNDTDPSDGGNKDTDPVEDTAFDLETNSSDPENDGKYTPEF